MALHHGRDAADPLVLPGPWDAASARVFAEAGFPALATPSAGISASLGYRDGAGHPARRDVRGDRPHHPGGRTCRSAPTSRPDTGCPPRSWSSGCSKPGPPGATWRTPTRGPAPLVEPKAQADYLARVRAAAGDALVLNARVDTYLRGEPDDGRRGGARAALRGGGRGLRLPDPVPARGARRPGGGHRRAAATPSARPGGRSPRELGVLGATRVTFGGGLHHQALDALRAVAEGLRT